MYLVEGIYKEVLEDEALDSYHYIEFDGHYYIKQHFDVDETYALSLISAK